MNPVVRTPHAASASPSAHWHILHDDGSRSGLTDLDTLKRWAAEGRITATCSVSQDGQSWTSAAALADLEMDWLVLVSADSVIGPFAFAALEALRASGDIPPEAQIFRRQTAAACGSQGTQLVQRAVAAEAQRREAETQLLQLRANLEAKDHEFMAERQQFAADASRAKADMLRREAESNALREEVGRLAAAAREREGLEARIVDLEREGAALRSTGETLRKHYDEQARRLVVLATAFREQLAQMTLPMLPTAVAHATPTPAADGPAVVSTEASAEAPGPPLPKPVEPVEVLPPERPRRATEPVAAATSHRIPSSLATLEARAQQELARLKSAKSDGATFRSRHGKSPA